MNYENLNSFENLGKVMTLPFYTVGWLEFSHPRTHIWSEEHCKEGY